LRAAASVDAAAPPDLSSDSFDWGYLLRAAERQGVAPLLYDWLHRYPAVLINPQTLEALRAQYWVNHFRNRLFLTELARVLEAAASASLAVMPLKGAQLATLFYPSPALRPLSDLDLLVKPRDLEALHRVLASLGYRAFEPEPSYVEASRLSTESAEQCWTAVRDATETLIETRINPLELAAARLTDVDPAFTQRVRDYGAHVWTRAIADGDGAGPPRSVMSPEDLLLHVVTHFAAKHVDFRLIWMHDVARILTASPDFDWDYFWLQVRTLRVRAAVCVALDAVMRWIGAPVDAVSLERSTRSLFDPSASALERWEYRRLCDYSASLAERDLTVPGPGVWPLGAALARVSDWPSRWRVLRWVAFPSRAYVTHRQHDSSRVMASVRAYTSRLRTGG
jgi:hypothetical protein